MKRKLFWIGGVVVLLLAVGVTLAVADTGDQVYHACVNNDSGTIKVFINPLESIECKTNEVYVTWNSEGLQGPPGADGSSCTVTGENGTYSLNCTDGTAVTISDGANGAPGVDGTDGEDGVNCWDLDGDGLNDPSEDTNLDGLHNTADCQGLQGEQGPEGPPGPDLSSLDELDGIPCGLGVLDVSYSYSGDVQLSCPGALSVTERIVFVTESTHPGYFFRNRVYPDEVCQDEATSAGLDGIFKAWISDNWTNPQDSFVHSDVPYKLVDGTQVAADWADLVDGTLGNPINRDPLDQLTESSVWTGTNADGTLKAGYPDYETCNNWEGGTGGGKGNSTSTTYWSNSGSVSCSGNFFRFYCFQQ